LPGTNALAFYEKSQLTAVKSFVTLVPGAHDPDRAGDEPADLEADVDGQQKDDNVVAPLGQRRRQPTAQPGIDLVEEEVKNRRDETRRSGDDVPGRKERLGIALAEVERPYHQDRQGQERYDEVLKSIFVIIVQPFGRISKLILKKYLLKL
jgi:hypothetical protein